MSEFLLRPPSEADLPEIIDCWQRSFGDTPELIRTLLETGELLSCAMAAEQDGHLRSVMFAFDGLDFDGIPAAYLYALCTHPDVRSQGMGRAVLRALTSLCFDRGAELVFLSPADAGLTDWYRSMGMHRIRPENVSPINVIGEEPSVSLTLVSAEEYAVLRRSPIGVPLRLLRAQELLSRSCGGGFYRVDCDHETAVLCAEPDGSRLRIRELCCAPEQRASVFRAAADAFQRSSISVGTGEIVYITKSPEVVFPACLAEFPFILD